MELEDQLRKVWQTVGIGREFSCRLTGRFYCSLKAIAAIADPVPPMILGFSETDTWTFSFHGFPLQIVYSLPYTVSFFGGHYTVILLRPKCLEQGEIKLVHVNLSVL